MEKGSSPRLRGTPVPLRPRGLRWGIIPALAGNTMGSFGPFLVRRDHPRACGEHAVPHALLTLSEGSSPRLRGTPILARRWPCGLGIIPALAGNTKERFTLRFKERDHPRACGEHTMKSQ